MNLGSHDWFVGEVVAINVDEDVVAGKKKLLWDVLPVYKGEGSLYYYRGETFLGKKVLPPNPLSKNFYLNTSVLPLSACLDSP